MAVNRLTIIWAILIVSCLAFLASVVIGLYEYVVSKYAFKQKSNFTVQYDKELELFKSLNSNEQAEYLELSRDQKIVKYGTKLK